MKRSAPAGWAGYGYCAPHSRFYWGVKLYLVTTLDGMPLAWCLADPKIGEREVAAELLGHAHDLSALPAGVVMIGDKGFAGKDFQRDMTELFNPTRDQPSGANEFLGKPSAFPR